MKHSDTIVTRASQSPTVEQLPEVSYQNSMYDVQYKSTSIYQILGVGPLSFLFYSV